ncbi:MAG: hypothetical protein CTY27_06180 [Methylotenera sp.]|nr:MAG: hypothetical protein CTY27_06180 [Methylotenera sp.]
MYKFWIFALILLLTSCASKQISCKYDDDRSFEQFFSRWSVDKAFSLERTKNPLANFIYIAGNENQKEGEKVKTFHSSTEELAGYLTLHQYESKNGLSHKIKTLTNDRAIVSVFLSDSDWLLDYHFIRLDGCWFLEEVHDYST